MKSYDQTEIPAILLDLHKNFVCSICLEVAKNPVFTQCNHKFCSLCILSVLKNNVRSFCPLCMTRIYKRGLVKHEMYTKIAHGVKILLNAVKEDSRGLYSPPSSQYKITDPSSNERDRKSSEGSACPKACKKAEASKPQECNDKVEECRIDIDQSVRVSNPAEINTVDEMTIPSSWIPSNHNLKNQNKKTYLKPKNGNEFQKISEKSPLTPGSKVQAWLNNPKCSPLDLNLQDEDLTQKLLSPIDDSFKPGSDDASGGDSNHDVEMPSPIDDDGNSPRKVSLAEQINFNSDTSVNVFVTPAPQAEADTQGGDLVVPKPRKQRRSKGSRSSKDSSVQSQAKALSDEFNRIEAFDLVVGNRDIPISVVDDETKNEETGGEASTVLAVSEPFHTGNKNERGNGKNNKTRRSKRRQTKLKDVTNFFVANSCWKTTKEMAKQLQNVASFENEIHRANVDANHSNKPMLGPAVQRKTDVEDVNTDDPYVFISSQKIKKCPIKKVKNGESQVMRIAGIKPLDDLVTEVTEEPVSITDKADRDSDVTDEIELGDEIIFAPTPERFRSETKSVEVCDNVMDDCDPGKVEENDVGTIVPESDCCNLSSIDIPVMDPSNRKTFCLDAETQDLLLMTKNPLNTLDEITALDLESQGPTNDDEPAPICKVPEIDEKTEPACEEISEVKDHPKQQVLPPLPNPNRRRRVAIRIQKNVKPRVSFRLVGRLEKLCHGPEGNSSCCRCSSPAKNREPVEARIEKEFSNQSVQTDLNMHFEVRTPSTSLDKCIQVEHTKDPSTVDKSTQVDAPAENLQTCDKAIQAQLSDDVRVPVLPDCTKVLNTEEVEADENFWSCSEHDNSNARAKLLEKANKSSDVVRLEKNDKDDESETPSLDQTGNSDAEVTVIESQAVSLKDKNGSHRSSGSSRNLTFRKVKNTSTRRFSSSSSESEDEVPNQSSGSDSNVNHDEDDKISLSGSVQSHERPKRRRPNEDLIKNIQKTMKNKCQPEISSSDESLLEEPLYIQALLNSNQNKMDVSGSCYKNGDKADESSTMQSGEATVPGARVKASGAKFKRIRSLESSESENELEILKGLTPEDSAGAVKRRKISSSSPKTSAENKESQFNDLNLSSQNSQILTNETKKINSVTSISILSGISQLDNTEKRQEVEEGLKMEIQALKNQMKSMSEKLKKELQNKNATSDEDKQIRNDSPIVSETQKSHRSVMDDFLYGLDDNDRNSQDLFMSPPVPTQSQPRSQALSNDCSISSSDISCLFNDDFI